MPIKSLKNLCAFSLVFLLLSNVGCSHNVATLSTSHEKIEVPSQAKTYDHPQSEKITSDKPTIVILATGGTIAGTGAPGKSTNYNPGQLSVDTLAKVAELNDLANIKGEQICNINSDDITSEIWLKIAKRINLLSQDPSIYGFVVTHGTDTLDETAFFLNLTVKTDKPVVITGSMRPSTAISADGPLNLHQAVALSASKKAKGKGVLAVISDRIYGARNLRKISTFNVNAFSEGDYGCLGYIIDDNILFMHHTDKLHTLNSEFDISNLNTLPKVAVVYFNVDSDSSIIDYYANKGYKGLVIAGAGSGEYSKAWDDAIKRHKHMVFVRSTRVSGGYVSDNDHFDGPNVIGGHDLQPQKAAVLLRLALAKTHNINKIKKIFRLY